MVNQGTGEIICTAHGKGRQHDFRIFKNSKVRLRAAIKVLADKGYQGIQKFHSHSQTPKKKIRGNPLSIADKKSNRELAIVKVLGENVHCKLKVFKILSSSYRNRRQRFGLRFNLLAGLYNYELGLLKSYSA